MLARTEHPTQSPVSELRSTLAHQAHRDLHAQDSLHRIVDPRHRDATFINQFAQQADESPVVRRLHRHIHARVDRLLDRCLKVFIDLADRVVIGNQKAFEPKFALQNLSQQSFARRTLHAVPTAVRDHDRAHAGFDRADVARQVYAAQFSFAQPRIALIEQVLLLSIHLPGSH